MPKSKKMTKLKENTQLNKEEKVLTEDELNQVSAGINLWEIHPNDTTDVGDDTKDKI